LPQTKFSSAAGDSLYATGGGLFVVGMLNVEPTTPSTSQYRIPELFGRNRFFSET
jgi:hypothetical protein